MTPAKISSSQVKHIAKLADLKLTSTEAKRLQKQLAAILAYADRLQAVNTAKVMPTSQVTGLENVTRPDQQGACLTAGQALANAAKKKNHYFVIPPISEQWH